MTSSSSVARRYRERRAACSAALAIALSLFAAAAFADGGEAVEPGSAPAARALESRWRRPEGCVPAPSFATREDGARVLSAQSESPACRVHGDADAQVRAWLETLSVAVDARNRSRPRAYPRR